MKNKKLDPELPVVMLDGYGYVGYLELLTLELKLPVMAEWDYKRLKISPLLPASKKQDKLAHDEIPGAV